MKDGWKTVQLGDVSKVVNGGTPSTKVPEYWGADHLWITPAEMGNRTILYLDESRRKLTDEGLKSCSASLVPPKSVILSTRAPIGHLVVNTKPMAFNQGCRAIVPGDELFYKYIFYFLLGSVDFLNEMGSGTTFKELAAGKLKQVKVPLAPLPEQKRIVDILDEAFVGIEAAIANTEKNLTNARELFESYLKSIFSRRDEGWIESSIGDQMKLQRGFDITKKDQKPGSVPVVSSGGIKSYHDTAMVKAPGVVIGRKGSLGTAYFVEADFWPHDTTLWVKDFKSNNVRLVYYYLRSLDLKTLDSGAANPALNRNMVHPIRMFWPARDLQQQLVESLDSLGYEVQRLESIYQQKLSSLMEMKQSLLQKAFSGELTSKKVVRNEDLKEEEVA